MIDGLKFSFDSNELRNHFHYQISGCQRGLKWALAERGKFAKMSRNDDANEERIRHFESRIREFSVMADHLVPDEKYLLTKEEIEALGLFHLKAEE